MQISYFCLDLILYYNPSSTKYGLFIFQMILYTVNKFKFYIYTQIQYIFFLNKSEEELKKNYTPTKKMGNKVKMLTYIYSTLVEDILFHAWHHLL